MTKLKQEIDRDKFLKVFFKKLLETDSKKYGNIVKKYSEMKPKTINDYNIVITGLIRELKGIYFLDCDVNVRKHGLKKFEYDKNIGWYEVHVTILNKSSKLYVSWVETKNPSLQDTLRK